MDWGLGTDDWGLRTKGSFVYEIAQPSEEGRTWGIRPGVLGLEKGTDRLCPPRGACGDGHGNQQPDSDTDHQSRSVSGKPSGGAEGDWEEDGADHAVIVRRISVVRYPFSVKSGFVWKTEDSTDLDLRAGRRGKSCPGSIRLERKTETKAIGPGNGAPPRALRSDW